MTYTRAPGWLLLAGIIAACLTGSEGRLQARWTALDTALGGGSLALPFQGTWCASRGRLTLLGVSGDTGVGILVRTVTLEPGLFPVSDTLAARSYDSLMQKVEEAKQRASANAPA